MASNTAWTLIEYSRPGDTGSQAQRRKELKLSAIRSHTARVAHAQRRRSHQQRQPTADSAKSSGASSPQSHSNPLWEHDQAESQGDDGDAHSQGSWRSPSGEMRKHSPSPTSGIGNTKKDPFNSFPVVLTQREHRLMDNYFNVPFSGHAQVSVTDLLTGLCFHILRVVVESLFQLQFLSRLCLARRYGASWTLPLRHPRSRRNTTGTPA